MFKKKMCFLRVLIIGFMPFLAMSLMYAAQPVKEVPALSPAERAELERIVDMVDVDAIGAMAGNIENDMHETEQEAIRTRNAVLWSVPAAFPEDEFDKQVQNLHINLPWGQYSFGNKAYAKYRTVTSDMIATYGLNRSRAVFEFLQGLDDQYRAFGQKPSDVSGDDATVFDKVHPSVRTAIVPGLGLYDYLRGKRIIGLGFYRSDIKEAGFLAANMASGYGLFQDAVYAKRDITQVSIIKHVATISKLVKSVHAAGENKQELEKAKKALTEFVKKECALFRHNPLKKEVVWPIIKYIFIQRIIESFRDKKSVNSYYNPDQQIAFVKDTDGRYVRSGVTPISIMSLAKVCLAPVAEFSQTSKQAVYQVGQSLKMTDILFSNWHMHPKFYRLFSSVVGEALVLVMALKIMDGFLTDKFVNAIVTRSQEYAALLKEGKEVLSIEYPDNKEAEAIRLYELKLEKEIEMAFTSGQSPFWCWVEAKRKTFAKIAQAGFCCFIVPTILMKVAPVIYKLIKS